jgi:hypothetical protein
MNKALLVLILLFTAACTNGMPPKLPQTPSNAPVWDLNLDRWPRLCNRRQARMIWSRCRSDGQRDFAMGG